MRKKIMSAILLVATAVTVGYYPQKALAAPSVHGNLNGTDCSGSVSIDWQSATAETRYARGGTQIIAKATVYYWFTDYEESNYAIDETRGGGATARAYKKIGGADVKRGEGYHKVRYNGYEWSDNTVIYR